jgi:hypothetical protein
VTSTSYSRRTVAVGVAGVGAQHVAAGPHVEGCLLADVDDVGQPALAPHARVGGGEVEAADVALAVVGEGERGGAAVARAAVGVGAGDREDGEGEQDEAHEAANRGALAAIPGTPLLLRCWIGLGR